MTVIKLVITVNAQKLIDPHGNMYPKNAELIIKNHTESTHAPKLPLQISLKMRSLYLRTSWWVKIVTFGPSFDPSKSLKGAKSSVKIGLLKMVISMYLPTFLQLYNY